MPITTTPSGGPQGEFSTYTPIYSTTFSSAASSITFSNIPTTFTDLVVSIGGNFSADISAGIYFNGDTGSNYAVTRMWGNGTSAQSSSSNGSTQIAITTGNGSTLSTYTVNVMNYSNTTTYKPVLGRASQDSVSARIGTWRSTSPITSMTLLANGGNFAVGTVVTVYGIKAAATQFIPTKAAGGDIVVSDGTYAYHAFLTSGVFSAATGLTADILVIAGGGGTANATGGAGAGGIIYATSQSLTSSSTYAVTVGAGGSVGTGGVGNKGNNSVFGSLITANGGGAGTRTGGSVANGGSGGGVVNGSTAGTASAGTGGTGYANAGAVAGVNVAYGGGGGSGQAGQTTGVGGNGLNTWSAWATATNTGVNGYYAGGGGGPMNSPTPSSGNAGGLGGGGASGDRSSTTATAGVPGALNTGSGAGGGGVGNSVDGAGATGGSGIVIVRYAL